MVLPSLFPASSPLVLQDGLEVPGIHNLAFVLSNSQCFLWYTSTLLQVPPVTSFTLNPNKSSMSVSNALTILYKITTCYHPFLPSHPILFFPLCHITIWNAFYLFVWLLCPLTTVEFVFHDDRDLCCLVTVILINGVYTHYFIYTYTHIHIYICIHIHTHTYTHTYQHLISS